jgi:hypothetical protein
MSSFLYFGSTACTVKHPESSPQCSTASRNSVDVAVDCRGRTLEYIFRWG